MNIAAFENEPDAEATATVLRENGYDAQVVLKGGEEYEERMHDFFQGKPVAFEAHALVLSDADDDIFMRNVQRHYGHIIRGEA
jgi:hypothetical protein